MVAKNFHCAFKTRPLFPKQFVRLCVILALLALLTAVSCLGQSLVTLAWDPSPSPGVAGYNIHVGTAPGTYTEVVDAGNQTSAILSGLTPGATYFFAAAAYDATDIEGSYSAEISYTVPEQSPPPPTPPDPTNAAPWIQVDIGTPGRTGAATLSSATNIVSGAGNISGGSDNFSLLYEPLIGDGQISARILSADGSNMAGRCGVMIRESLTSGSKYAFMGMTLEGSAQWQRRGVTGGNTYGITASSAVLPDYWVRLVRSGNSITGYRSDDGTNWVQVGSRNFNMATRIYFGLAVASGSTNDLSSVSFTDLSVTP